MLKSSWPETSFQDSKTKRGTVVFHETGRGSPRKRIVYSPGMKGSDLVRDAEKTALSVIDAEREKIQKEKDERARVQAIRAQVSKAAEEFPNSKLKFKVSKDGKPTLQRREGGKFQKGISLL
jgi:hypothetical protein